MFCVFCTPNLGETPDVFNRKNFGGRLKRVLALFGELVFGFFILKNSAEIDHNMAPVKSA